jgi:uncharacterized protein YndB with AHSA1/START domain
MNEVITKRNFNAPVELLFKAWAQPGHLKNWWGPNGFTNTFHEFDFKPEGNWRFTMHSPGGKDYFNESVFKIIVENEFIVLEHKSEPQFRVEASFAGNGNTSSLVWKMIFSKMEVYQSLKDFVAEKNEENLNRLEAELEKMKS